MVNLIRSHPLNYRQFREILKETDTEAVYLLYYIAVRWISCGKVLTRVFELREKICECLESKGKPHTLLSDEEWVWKLALSQTLLIV